MLVKVLADEGLNRCEIARATGIPRGTVSAWLFGREPRFGRPGRDACSNCGHDLHNPPLLPQAAYAYLLGLYLGDGCISTSGKGVHRLRITLDMRYPGIIGGCARAMKLVMPRNAVLIQRYVGGHRAAEVGSSSKSWPCLFPQHGRGAKHLRHLVLEDWQHVIVDQDPRPLIRGLIHSDGCRVLNKSLGREYLRYFFDNASVDIRGIFCAACDRLGIEWRQPKERTISIARRDSVALLDTFVGPKS